MSTPLLAPAPGVLTVGTYTQARRHGRKYDAVLTLEDPQTRDRLRLQPPVSQLVLQFEDCDDTSFGYAVATRAQVEQALAFLAQHSHGSLLVHCYHGVGRSAALALAALAMRTTEPVAAVETLQALRPESVPNLVVVEHADAILGYSGALLAAVHAYEAGQPGKLAARRRRREYALANPGLFAKAVTD